MSTQFFSLELADVTPETKQAVLLQFKVPEHLSTAFAFQPGQYLTLEAMIDGKPVRRSYSLCSAPNSQEWQVAVKAVPNGKFSQFALHHLKAGDTLAVMPPQGNFTPKTVTRTSDYLAFAGGSGITPILSIMQSLLADPLKHRFTLIYSNQTLQSTLFVEKLEALKNLYPDRLRLLFFFSRENAETALFNGRLNHQKCLALQPVLLPLHQYAQVFLCGPFGMVDTVENWLKEQGYPANQIARELFAAPDQVSKVAPDPSTLPQGCDATIILDGRSTRITIPAGTTILDAAAENGLDVPYACKGGVCCTCKAQLQLGSVTMQRNFALTEEELSRNYILTCQSIARTNALIVNYDER